MYHVSVSTTEMNVFCQKMHTYIYIYIGIQMSLFVKFIRVSFTSDSE